MFFVNKEARTFLLKHFPTIQNGFINDGLIHYQIYSDFNGFEQLEKLYFEALKRNMCNRIITLEIRIDCNNDLLILNEVQSWIKAQQQNIKLQFKFIIYYCNSKELIEFLKSNCIIELDVSGLIQELPHTICHQITRLAIRDRFKYVNLEQFNKLQILEIWLNTDYIYEVIPYLASKFTPDHFRRMQVKFYVRKYYDFFESIDTKLDKHHNINPKIIQIAWYDDELPNLYMLFE